MDVLRLQKLDDISNDENTLYCVKPMRIVLGKSQVCNLTRFSGTLNNSVFDRITLSLKRSEENGRHEYVYFGGDMVCL